MPLRSRLIWSLLTCVSLIGVVRLGAQPPKAATDDPPRTSDSGSDSLKQSLTQLGYREIALERLKFGHLLVQVEVEDKEGKRTLRMVVDSGSSVTLVTPDAAQALGLVVEKTGGTVGGVGGAGIAVSATKSKSFKIGEYEEEDVPLAVIDIGHVNAHVVGSGEKALDGVIGSDWMLAKKALIDVGSARLFVLPPKSK